MRAGILISSLLLVASVSSMVGCGAADVEDPTAEEEEALLCFFPAGYGCIAVSRDNLSGRRCNCRDTGICGGYLRNDDPHVPSTYFCRAQ